MRWTKEEEDYLRRNFNKKSVPTISEKLNKTCPSIYNKAQKMNLKKRRRWTKKEEEYIADSIGEMEVPMIGKQLLRTKEAIYEKAGNMGLKIRNNNELTLNRISSRIGIFPQKFYKDIKNGKLQVEDRTPSGLKTYIFNLYDIRDYLMKDNPYRKLKCYDCGIDVVGDIFCYDHLPYELKKKTVKHLPYRYYARSESEDIHKDIGDIFMNLRKEKGISQFDLSEEIGYNRRWYCAIELGKKNSLTIDDLVRTADALGCNITIQIERRSKSE